MKKGLIVLTIIGLVFVGACSKDENVNNKEKLTNDSSINTEFELNESNMFAAIEDRNITRCDEVTDKQLQESCRDTIYINLSIEEKNRSLCNKVVSAQKREICSNL